MHGGVPRTGAGILKSPQNNWPLMGNNLVAIRIRARRWFLAATGFQALLYAAGFGVAAGVAAQLVRRWTREDPGTWTGLVVAAIVLMAGAMALAALLLRRHSWTTWRIARKWFLPWTHEQWGRVRLEAGLIIAEAMVLCFAGLNGVFREPFRQDLAAAGAAALVAGLVAALVGIRLAWLLRRMHAASTTAAAPPAGPAV